MDREEKFCPKCLTVKPIGEFSRNRARSDGRAGYCRLCQNESTSGNYQRLRLEVIVALGGPTCRRCGFDDLRALVIDHIEGAGNQHRKDSVSVYSVYKHALAHPEEYQVLCANCNQIKRHEEGEWASKEYMERCLATVRVRVTHPTRWARDFDRCTECGTVDVPHKAAGKCRNCYMRVRRS